MFVTRFFFFYSLVKSVTPLINTNPHALKHIFSLSERLTDDTALTLPATSSGSALRCPHLLREYSGSSENLESRFKINTTG